MTAKMHSNDATMQAQAGTHQYLTFLLAGEEYGVNILSVQEIRGCTSVTPIPNTPEYVLGVINLRGTVVPIVDLRKRFGLAAAEFGATTVFVVVRAIGLDRNRTMGMVVDAVSDVYNISPDEVKPAPDVGNTVDHDFVTGLATVDDKMMILLDVDRVINSSISEPLQTP
ncbi:MAG: chemotaxis protein CheW [Gammaproteobacteria bacterium]